MKSHLLKSIIFIVLAIFLSPSCEEPEQVPEYEFKTFGGSGFDWGNSIQQTKDGGYIIAGCTDSYGAGIDDVWLIKTDASGDTAWTRTYGGSSIDWGKSVQQTSDGGYIITGFTRSFGAGVYDVWLIKTDASGDTAWTKTFGGSYSDKGNSVQQTSDGGYIITGETYSDVWLIKTDVTGDTVWTKTFGGRYHDEGNYVRQTSDGGYIIAGHTGSSFDISGDVCLIKTDALGDMVWTRTFGGSADDKGRSVQQTADGGYIVVGETATDEAIFYDVYLIKTDASGDTVWTRTFGGINHDDGYSVQQTADRGYIIAGGTASYGAGHFDVWLIKTNASGDIAWTRTIGGIGSDRGYSMQPTSDGGYIITGPTSSYEAGSNDVLLIKTDEDGNVESFE